MGIVLVSLTVLLALAMAVAIGLLPFDFLKISAAFIIVMLWSIFIGIPSVMRTLAKIKAWGIWLWRIISPRPRKRLFQGDLKPLRGVWGGPFHP